MARKKRAARKRSSTPKPRGPRKAKAVQLELAPPVATAEELQVRQETPEYHRSRDGLTG